MRFKKAASRAGSVFIFLFFGLSLLIFISVIASGGDGVPSFYGYSFLNVTTSSMDPVYPVGCIVITKKVDVKEFAVGDVVSFYSEDPEIYGTPNTHRIVSIGYTEANKTFFITKGDNNPITDRYKVYEDKVIGKVRGSIGSLGKLLTIIKNRVVLFFLLIVPLAVVAFFEIRHIRKIIKSKDGQTPPDELKSAEETVAEIVAAGEGGGADELLEKINRIQAEIDRLNAQTNNPDSKI